MKPLLIATSDTRAADLLALTPAGAEVRRVAAVPAASSLELGRPTVVIVDQAMLGATGTVREQAWALGAVATCAALLGCGAPGQSVAPPDFPDDHLSAFVAGDASPNALGAALRRALRLARALASAHEARVGAAASRVALADLTRAGIALGSERDPAALLATILTQARRITNSDAGSIYLLERGAAAGEPGVLRCRLSQNHSRPDLPLESFTIPADHASLAGHAATTGAPLVIADSRLLPPGTPYRMNRTFDDRFGYETRSVLVIPMKSQRDEIVGVLQLINGKRSAATRLLTPGDVEREVVPFDTQAVAHVTALAAQAAVSIENSSLYASIEGLFDGFVAAAAAAVEARDPATSGHSQRVGALAMRLADAVNAGAGAGAFRTVRFGRDELLALRYAALLHDFGKVAVREELLVKVKKLHPHALEAVEYRFAALAAREQLECERAKVALLTQATTAQELPAARARCAALDADSLARRAELDAMLATVLQANDATWLSTAQVAALEAVAARSYIDAAGNPRALLSPGELRYLSIRRGNLDDTERGEVEAHVSHTFHFLEQIPWTPSLAAVPHIAHAHHERPNGQGYPRGLVGSAIPVAARVIAVVDVFDALTAADRSYRPAVTAARALEIMRADARDGALDADLVETFARAGIGGPTPARAAPRTWPRGRARDATTGSGDPRRSGLTPAFGGPLQPA